MESVSAIACLFRPLLNFLGKAKNINCGSLTAIIIPRFSGKSTLISSVVSRTHLLLDIEENVKLELTEQEKVKLNSLVGNSSFNLHYYPIVRDYILKVRNNHKHKKIVIVCSDIELVKYLNIKNHFCYVPSNSLTENIKTNLADTEKTIYEQSRLDLLVNVNQKDITSYSDFATLANMIIGKFKLAQKL
jgi:hypothetical protein